MDGVTSGNDDGYFDGTSRAATGAETGAAVGVLDVANLGTKLGAVDDKIVNAEVGFKVG